jgi:amino acid adenylation domain-containing protein
VAPVNFSSIVDLLHRRAAECNGDTGYTFLADGEAAATHLTFAAMDRRARAIGALLQQAASPGERALLLFPPGIEFISAFFGCLYAGVIAVPAYPPRAAKGQERLRSIVRDSRPRVVLTTAALRSRAERLADQDPELRAALWQTTDDLPAELADEWVPPALSLETLAFLQYTSGSTAAPKGVMVSHGNLLHNEEVIRLAFRQSAESVIVGWLPLYHDMGLIGNVLQPLYVGARCILMSPLAFLQRPLRWLAAISRYRGTTSGGPNFAYDLCVRKIGEEERRSLDLGSWQVAFNGAEPVRGDTLDRFAAAFAPHGFDRRAFFPCYGLAEATLFVTGGPAGREPLVERLDPAALEQGLAAPGGDEGSRRLVSCGQAWEGYELRIVDPETGLPCLPGRVGEIWVDGPSIAHGYWNLPEETERSFQALAADGSGPWLRTGDLGFRLGDELFVTGRAKDLIILRGRNLYPQDLELSAERSHPALRPGCGAAFSVDVGDEERLVVVQELERGAEGAAAEAAAAIRGALAEEFEVQTYEVLLLRHDSVPKTSSGKIQRHACRQRYLAGELDPVDRSRAEMEEGGGEDAGMADWRELAPGPRRSWLEFWLGRELSRLFGRLAEGIDPEQPLTRVGLDSLGAVELQHALETGLGATVGLAELLEGASLRQLAERIEQGGPRADAPLAPLPERSAGYPLTHNQRALWFLQRLQPGSTAYSIVAAAEVEPALDTAVLRRALYLLTMRHEALRLGFSESEAGPVQQAVPGRTVELAEEDAAGWSAARLAARLDEIAHRPFDLERDPLLRLTVFQGTSCVVLLTVHHVIADLWSLALLVRDLGDLYTRLLAGEEPPAGAPGPRFTDYALWQEQRLSGERGEALWAYWREQLAGELPVADLPADRQRPPVQSFAGGARSRWLDRGFLGLLQETAGAHHATLYTLLLAAFQALLHRLSGRDDLLVGSPTAGREGAGTAGLVGLFVNSVVLRSRASAASTFDRFLAATRQTALDAFAHQDYPFPLLVERLQPQRHPGASPLFQVMFALQRSHLSGIGDLAAFALGEAGARIEVAGLQLLSRRVEHRAAQFDLELTAAEGRRGLGLALSYGTDLFDATTAERILGGFEALLRGAVENPGRRIAELPLLSAGERHQLLLDWNDTAAALDHGCSYGRSFPALFEEQVRRRPDAPAVSCAGWELTYAQLDDLAKRMAGGLLDAGLGREGRVALWAERGIEFLAAMIAVFKAGGAYLPLDPRQPVRRLVQMVRSSGACLVLTSPERHAAAAAALGETPGPAVLPLAGLRGAGAGEGMPDGPLPGQLAYVLFTSGSTGAPKAAMIEHRSLLNHLWSKTVHPPLTSADRVAQTAAATFDISIWQFLAPLLVGGSVHVVPDEVAGDPPRLLAEIARQRITVLETVPSLLWPLVQESEAGPAPDLSTLRWLIPTGEALPPDLCRRWLARFPCIPLLNAYGPTECADDVSVHPIHTPPPEASPRMPIGRPVGNLRLYVLDGDLAPVPIGVPGELFVAGAGVGRGYFGDPARTAAVFIPDPHDEAGGGRLYRTGDIGLRRPDGLLDFLGRGDHQVKVRGFRIELGEIEAALRAHPGVAQAVVLAYPDPRGDKRLAAFWTTEPGASATAGELRQLLRQSLPDAMLPAAYVQLAAMPLATSGKVDRRALPEPDWSGSPERPPAPYIAARDEIEEMVAGVFARVLGQERVGPGDDFFELGGHSLLATQVAARLRQELGVELPLQALFEAPTPAGVAVRVRGLLASSQPGDAPPPLRPSPRGSDLPLSFAQQRLWFLHELEPASPAYNMPGAVRLRGRLRIEVLAASLEAVAGRHEALRTVFRSAEGVPHQVILPRVEVRLPLVDLAGLPEAIREELAGQLAAAESRRPFDLSRGPLFRAALLHLGTDDHLLLFTLHHIVSDGWSQGVLVRDMSAFYEACLQGTEQEKEAELPPLPVQYADFALWQREWLQGERVAAQIAYWRVQLGGEHAALELPLDHPRPPRRTDRGARRALAVPAGPALELARLSRRQGGTPFMGLLTVVAACLHRYSGQERIHVGAPVANRRMAELEGLIGFFVNTLVLRADFGDAPSLAVLLERLRRTALEAYMHQDVPFERLVEELQPERDLSRSPLFQAMLVLQNAPAPRLELPGLRLAVSEVDNGTAKLELTLSLEETGDGLAGWIEYNSDLFDGTTAERIGTHFGHLLAAAAASPETPLAELPLLGESGRFQLLVEWNDTRVEIPREGLVHRLVAAQAERTPDAVAVSGGGIELTYRELTRRAGHLARTLRAAGATPDIPVGIFAERSCEMVVGVLAILEAGGAYLPLDPLYPRERLAALLDDSGASVVLAQEHLVAALPSRELRIVPLGADVPDGPDVPDEGPRPRPGNLAYVLFTSGSTGRPKGVQVPHCALVSLLTGLAGMALGGRTLLSVTTLAFDIASVEIFLPLTTGGRVVLADRETVLDGARLAAEAERVQADLLQATPATWRMLAEAGWSGKADLTAITTGEAAPRDLAEWLRARVGVLWNLYGPTETTVFSSFQRVGTRDGSVPIGRPVANTRLLILDRALAPVPPGVVGELYIGGAGVARGYACRPDLTAERFIPDPLGAEPGERLYRTGDLCRHLADGTIEYLGRADHQVKLRGFRIELPEIEAVLASHPAVEQTVVAVRETGTGDRRLVAWFVAPGPEVPAPGELRDLLKRHLPDYMVPAHYVRLDAMPLTSNGKVDRRALPDPVAEAGAAQPSAAPRDASEEILTGIFARVLGLEGDRERLGADENFFELGGHSLLATRIMSRINATFGVDLPLRSLFETPTVAGLARSIATARQARQQPPLRRIPRGVPHAPLAVSFVQEQLWLMEQLAPGSAVYNVFQALRLTGPLSAAALEGSLVEVIRRHEALRTRITTVQGRPVQMIDPEPRFALARVDLSGLAPAAREGEVSRLAQAEARRPFRLAREPLMRGLLLFLGADAHALLLAMHHIVSDDWSVGLLVHEVGELYQASLAGRPAVLPELSCQYADYAQWQRDWMQGEVLDEELGHWARRLGTDLPVLDLPTDRPRPPRQSMQGSVEPFAVPAPLAASLRQLGRDEGATLFMVLLAGFAVVLGHSAGQTDLVVGTPVAGRTRPEIEPLIGFFVNLLPLRLDLSGRPAYRDLIARARDVALDAYGHQGVPFEKLVETFQPRRDPSRPAIRHVALSVQESSMQPIALGEGLRIEPIATDPGVSRLDLTLFLGYAGEGLAGYCEYDSALFDRTTILRLLDFLRLALEDMAADPGRQLLALPPRIERTAGLVGETAPAPETNLTPGQLLFWFAPKLQPGVQLYFDRATTTFTMEGDLDERCFERAFRRLVELCDTLQTRVVEHGGIPRRVVGAVPPDPLERVDLSSEAAPEAALAAWLTERTQRAFDLGERLFDAALHRLGRGRFVWFFDIHHIGADAGSLQTLAAHLSHLYDLARQDRLDEGLPLPSYDEYAAEEIRYSESESYQADRRYWEIKLARSAGTNLFYRRPGTPFTTRTERISFDLETTESGRVRALVSRGGLFSPAVVFVSTLFALLYRVHGDSRLRIGTSFSNRPHRFREVVGLMMNTCPLQIEVGDDETFRSLLRRVQGELVETSRHQRYPVRNPVGERAYNVYINFQTMSYTELCGFPVRFDLTSTEHSNDHLNVQVSDFTACGSFRVDLDFNLTAFAGPESVRTAGHFRNLLAALLDDPDGRLASAPMLSPAELQQIGSPEEHAAEAPGDSFADLLAAQVKRTPGACAASYRGERITYRQLAERVDGLARRLHKAGSGPEVPVALMGARNLDFLAALIAIVRTGGVYLPLDPHHPPQRLVRILETSGASLVLASATSQRLAREVQALLPSGRQLEILPLEARSEAAAVAPLPPIRPGGLAYILFTSGSTGMPKGVMVAWPGMLNHLRAKVLELGLMEADVVAQNASQSFDISVWQFLAVLLVGGRVHIVDDETALDAAKLLRETAAEGVTVLEIVPSLLAVLLDAAARRPVDLPRLRWLVPTGEALPAELCRRWFALYPGVPLLNAYGPTECSDDVTHHPILGPAGAADLGTTPIGRPLPGIRLHVVDRQLELLPAGLPGELCVGGICVGRGYLREPDRTADAFRPDPFAGEPGARLYRTGDLGRRLEDGTLEFLGRIDHQVKVRGFRIELGEIEAALMSFPGLREAVVLAREDRPTDRRLVAYYVPEPGWGPTATQLRGFLSSKLPEYMVPAAFVALESMPLTPNGKVDRRALPPPDAAQDPGRTGAAVPSSPLESLIASICSQVLRVEPIGLHDNFFELGGNSLLATQVVTQVQEILPVEIDLRHLFEAPTVSKLAAVIDSQRGDLGEQERALLAEILADYEQMSAGSL